MITLPGSLSPASGSTWISGSALRDIGDGDAPYISSLLNAVVPVFDGARDTLSAVLRQLPPNDLAEPALAEAYRAWGTPDPFGPFEIGPDVVVLGVDPAKRRLFLVYDSRDRSVPYLASLLKTADGWDVEWLASECASCFGTGYADNSSCETCGGSGWGTLDSSPHRYSLPRTERPGSSSIGRAEAS